MSWKKERDSLIAQTMAFVQAVASRKEDIVPQNAGFAPAVTPAESSAPFDPQAWIMPKAGAPAEPAERQQRPPMPAARPVVAGELASEIRARIAGFRAHQERFNREREEYFSETLARLKAEIKEMPPPRAGK